VRATLGDGNFLRFRLAIERVWAHWHLQHSRLLAWAQFRHFDYLTVRQFKGIMMDAGPVYIDLPKPGQLVPELFRTEAKSPIALKVLLKGKLRAR
jgi:hypothetical protein